MKLIQVIMLGMLPIFVFAQGENKFESVTANFKVTKPNEWQFITAEDNFENLKKTKMKSENHQKLMLKYATVPLVAMKKHSEPFDDLNPSLRVNIKPLGGLKGTDPKQILALFLPQFQKMFQDFNLTQPPKDAKIGGLEGAYMRINYSMAIPDGRIFPTTSELWIVPRGDYFFVIGTGTRQDEKTGTRAEIANILSSVAF